MKRLVSIGSIATLLIVALLLHSPIKNFLWAHPWTHSFLVALPALLLLFLEWRDSIEANTLRGEANALQKQRNQLQAALDSERNKQLQQIVKRMETPTLAEKNAAKLRDHLGRTVQVREGDNDCGPMEIVEVSGDNILTLFRPCGHAASSAFSIQVDCRDLRITDIPPGMPSPLVLTILRRYGTPVQWGGISRRDEREK